MPVLLPSYTLTLGVTDAGDGATADLAVGGTGGAPWAVLRAAWTGRTGGLNWQTAATGTGDGAAASAPGAGYYVWQAVAGTGGAILDLSPAVYQTVASVTDPVHERILQAVYTGLVALNLDGIGSRVFPQMYPRWNPDVEGAGPMLGFAPYPGEQDRGLLNTADDVGYPVLVGFFAAGGWDDLTRRARYLKWRRIVAAYFRRQRLAGVAAVYITDWKPTLILDAQATLKDMLIGSMLLTFWVRETRGLVTH